MPRSIYALVALSRVALGMTQAEVGSLTGVSTRSVQRWEAKKASPAPWQANRLADAVRVRDESLAAELDLLHPRPLPPEPPEVAPPPPAPPPPPPAPTLAASLLVDSVLCAAAEAMSLAPHLLRPALAAAFARARDVGLSADAVAEVLSAAKKEALPAGTSGAPGTT